MELATASVDLSAPRREAPPVDPGTDRVAVIDLGSNSFRLVVFTWTPDAPDPWWKRTDEIFESVRIGEGQDETLALQPAPMERALRTLELFAHFCRSTGVTDIRPVATSAIRAASNQAEFLEAAKARTGLDIQVLADEEEARYGYLAAVNSTTLEHGIALDIGGGSMQLTQVDRRRARAARSWRLGAVVMTERFLPDKRAKPKQIKALRAHVREELEQAPWVEGAGQAPGRRMTGVGGAVRNLAAAAQLAADLPSYGIQGFHLTREALDELVDEMADLPANERGDIPGIKPERSDLILASALVVQTVMDVAGFEELESTEAGLREGVFYERLLTGLDPPLFRDVRAAAVRNLAAQYHTDFSHSEHVARLALEMWDALGAAGAHPARPDERALLWAAGLLHDIGNAVDYDDHHKHSRYLILNSDLAGFSPRETALLGQMARYHRKGNPGLHEFESLARNGDEALLNRCAAVLRIAEQLERARDQAVHHARVVADDGRIEIVLDADEDVAVARWAAAQQGDVFRKAFNAELGVR